RTNPIAVAVRAGAPDVRAGSGVSAAQAAQNLLAAGGLRPIRLKLTRAGTSAPPWTHPWFWPLFAVGPVAAAGAMLIMRTRVAIASDAEGRRVRGAARAAKKRLRGAQALLQQRKGAAAFYAEITRALTQYLADKQQVAAAGMTRDELAAALAQRGHPDATVQRLLKILDDCDQARFAPAAGE